MQARRADCQTKAAVQAASHPVLVVEVVIVVAVAMAVAMVVHHHRTPPLLVAVEDVRNDRSKRGHTGGTDIIIPLSSASPPSTIPL